MTTHELHDRVIDRTYRWREKYYGPLVRLLVSAGISANAITTFRILFIIPLAYFLFVHTNLWGATITYVLFWIVDTLDGSVARATNTQSDRGKFLDVFIDNFVYSFLILSFIYLNAAPAPLLSYHVLIQITAYLLGVVYLNEGKPTDWIIKPQAEQQYNKIFAHLVIFLYVLGFDVLRLGFVILNTWLTLQAFYFYAGIYRRGKVTPQSHV